MSTAALPVAGLRADPLRGVVALIAAVTAVSGLAQLVAPGVVLDVLGAESTATGRHAFATVGMFMVVVGGLLLQALWRGPAPGYVLGWAAAQKAGAAVAVSWGVAVDVFGPLALAVAAFDALTAVLLIALWSRDRS